MWGSFQLRMKTTYIVSVMAVYKIIPTAIIIIFVIHIYTSISINNKIKGLIIWRVSTIFD